MKITIDCRHINSSGIGVYTKECLYFILDSANDFLLLGNAERLKFAANKSNVEIIHCTVKPFSLSELFVFPKEILKKINETDLFYSPYFNIPGGIKVPVYTTIHDILFPDMPELVSVPGLWIRMFFYRRSFGRSKKIFTVSNFSKSRIEYYSGGKKPVIVTQNAIQSHFLNNSSKIGTAEKKDFILFVGNIKKHKGLDCLLEAFIKAKKEGLKQTLLIVGNAEDFRSKDNSFKDKLSLFDSDEVKFTGFIQDDELRRLYTEAALLVQPSLYEGFGLPPLEAMYNGTVALISDIPVFHEIYDEFPVVFFKTGDPDDLKEKLLSLLLNKTPQIISLSDELLNKYSYKKTASIILKELSAE